MPSKNDILRVGVIGPGGAGRGNTLGFATRPDAQVVAAADAHEGSLDALENALQQRVEDYKPNSMTRYLGEHEYVEMLNNEDLDVVGVFSPHSLHDVHVKYALRAGCHVIVEKPMANIVGDAITITKIAIGSDLNLVGGYQRHYEDTYITGRRAVSEGLIGNLKKFEVYMAQRWGAGGWRGDPRFSGGGQPNDSGSHLQDIFLWMTQALPAEVYGTTDMKFEDNDGNLVPKFVEINSYSDVKLDNGAEGTITILGNTRVGFEEWVILEGDEGTIEIKKGVRYTPKGGDTDTLSYPRPDEYPKNKVDQLVGLVNGEYDTNYTSGINGIRTSWLTNSILEAGKEKKKKNNVDCEKLIEKEGYSRQDILDLTDLCTSKRMY